MTFFPFNLEKLEVSKIKILVSFLVSFLVGLYFAYSSLAKGDSNDPGRVLVDKKGCLNCHFSKGDGGFIGPPLDGIGNYLTEEQIVHRLTSPKPVKPMGQRFPSSDEFMRHVMLSAKEASQVAKYLRSIPESDLKASHAGRDLDKVLPKGFKFKPKKASKSTKEGRAKLQNYGCLACHSIRGKGGRLGSSLDGIGARRSRTFIESRIKRGAIIMFADKKYRPSRFIMPPSHLSDKDISLITDYLMTLPDNDLEQENSHKE